MKLLFSVILFSNIIIAADSTSTLIINGTPIKIDVPQEFYIDLVDFQNFLDGNIQDLHFSESIVEDLTGDNISDTLYNEVYIIKDSW